jgi:hypothetical protein
MTAKPPSFYYSGKKNWNLNDIEAFKDEVLTKRGTFTKEWEGKIVPYHGPYQILNTCWWIAAMRW